jgi:Protein of unknown function DUF262/Protein of unknown function (DUF1524)
MIKSVADVPLYTLLSPENNIVYRVPPYQREYSWSKQQWDELFDDLLDADPAGGHFLGTIICINQTVDATKEVVLELIDGQQRMTTLSLLLAAIYSQLVARHDELDEDQLTDLTNLRRQLVLKDPIRARVRPQRQNSNYEDYLAVLKKAGIEIAAQNPKYLGVRRIMKAFRHFEGRLGACAQEAGGSPVESLLDMLGRAKKALLVKLEVANHSDAFVLFESLNNRGMPLTPIDLIKTNLLAVADKTPGSDTNKVFAQWNDLLGDLGDDYGNQERFFRQFYNAFKTTLPAVQNVSVATRTNLIRIYETLIKEDLSTFLDRVAAAGLVYKRIIGNLDDDDTHRPLDDCLADLSKAQGAPSYMLLLYLLSHRDHLNLTDADLMRITRLLSSFFVRRNLTGVPQTYALQKLFMDIIGEVASRTDGTVSEIVAGSLRRVSATDDVFRERLGGPIYDENADVTRFILVSLAEEGMTAETWTDLWAREKNHYKWTIEHILPQGKNLPTDWIAMLGGDPTVAADAQARYVHTLGNLTITGYNSSLGNKSFPEKRERKDTNGNFTGYHNNLALNADVVSATQWTTTEIDTRTRQLADRTLKCFPLD